MKKTIYQLACFLQEKNNTHAISMEDFKEDTELAKEEILNLLTEKVGKCAGEDKFNLFTALVYDQGYIDGLRTGAQLMRLLNGDADAIKVTAEDENSFIFTSTGYRPGEWRFDVLTVEEFRRDRYKLVEGGQALAAKIKTTDDLHQWYRREFNV